MLIIRHLFKSTCHIDNHYALALTIAACTACNLRKVDTLGLEPRASRMLSGCDTTTPCALIIHAHRAFPCKRPCSDKMSVARATAPASPALH